MNTLNVAVAPISWGVCAVPGWGIQLPYDRVFREMRALGVSATESGPNGFLPDDLSDAARVLREGGISVIGTYVDLVLHEPDDRRWVSGLKETIGTLRALGGSTVVLAALAADMDYRVLEPINASQWSTLLKNFDEASAIAGDEGMKLVVHHHLATLVENDADIERVLNGSSVDLCVDTGHAIAAGVDPVRLVQRAGDRVRHVHLKDARDSVIRRLNSGQTDFLGSIDEGIFCRLGEGDLPIADFLAALSAQSFPGWIVIEQDVMLRDDSSDPLKDVTHSVEYLRTAIPEGISLSFGPSLR